MRAFSMRVLLLVLVVTAAFASAAEEADNAPFYEGTKCNVITKSSQLEALLKEGEPLFIEVSTRTACSTHVRALPLP
jgi:hypothetical protein